jgi:predicted MFS family arabinose efflux permease
MPGRGAARTSMREMLGQAMRHRQFLVMSGAYFVCGLNLVFLTTHLPTYLAICGQDPMLSAEALAVIGGTNCIGSLAAGWLGARYPKHILLGLLYILRAGVFTAYFMMPPTPVSTLIFAAAMGMLWLSVAPLVSGLVAEMFGTRYMATLLGISFVLHQVGSSLGAVGGGLIFDMTGSYDRAWQTGVLVGAAGSCRSRAARPPPRGPLPRGGRFTQRHGVRAAQRSARSSLTGCWRIRPLPYGSLTRPDERIVYHGDRGHG